MLNKILVFGGLSVTAILIIENMVLNGFSYVLWSYSPTYVLVIVSTIIGILIGYGVKGIGKNTNDDFENEDLDF